MAKAPALDPFGNALKDAPPPALDGLFAAPAATVEVGDGGRRHTYAPTPPLVSKPAHTRHLADAPGTSVAAAERAVSRGLGPAQRALLCVFALANRPVTDEEAFGKLRALAPARGWKPYQDNTLRPRRCELVEGGYLALVDENGRTLADCAAQRWQITEKGRDALERGAALRAVGTEGQGH